MSTEMGPDYRQLADLIRSRITAGEYPVGSLIPSTATLERQTGKSLTSVRRAVQELQAQGILEGHPGKGVYVKALPADADAEHMDIKALGEQVAELREIVEHGGQEEILAAVGRLEANLIELYGKTGHDYPHGGTHDGAENAAAGRGRARR